MTSKTQPEQSKMWRIPKLDDVQLLRGKNLTQSFPLHTHEQYAIGVIERGALGFFYRGENVVASQGEINLCIPDEPHTGEPAIPEGWSYRMFYTHTEGERMLSRPGLSLRTRAVQPWSPSAAVSCGSSSK